MTLVLISVASGNMHPSSKVSSFSISIQDTLRLLIMFTTALHPLCSLSVLHCLEVLKLLHAHYLVDMWKNLVNVGLTADVWDNVYCIDQALDLLLVYHTVYTDISVWEVWDRNTTVDHTEASEKKIIDKILDGTLIKQRAIAIYTCWN